jgi:DNA-binding response OmpR family regulator
MIILAEDDPDQRLALHLALKAAGYEVRTASNAQEALALQRERPSPILITDLFMPESDGFELIQAFRKDFPRTKIVVVSGGGRRTKADYVTSAKLLGADVALRKPVAIEVLLKTLRTLAPRLPDEPSNTIH